MTGQGGIPVKTYPTIAFQPYWKNTLNFIAAYRKTYSSSHVLMSVIENWKKYLDNKNIVGTVLMDLSKAFDCILHDLFIAKLQAYGFNKKALIFLYSYLLN